MAALQQFYSPMSPQKLNSSPIRIQVLFHPKNTGGARPEHGQIGNEESFPLDPFRSF